MNKPNKLDASTQKTIAVYILNRVNGVSEGQIKEAKKILYSQIDGGKGIDLNKLKGVIHSDTRLGDLAMSFEAAGLLETELYLPNF